MVLVFALALALVTRVEVVEAAKPMPLAGGETGEDGGDDSCVYVGDCGPECAWEWVGECGGERADADGADGCKR